MGLAGAGAGFFPPQASTPSAMATPKIRVMGWTLSLHAPGAWARDASFSRADADQGRRPRPARDQHDPDALDRRGPEGQQRPPGAAARRCADGVRAVAAP